MSRSRERPSEGINWGLVAGGAVATVLSLVYRSKQGRSSKQKQSKSAAQDRAAPSISSSVGNEEHDDGSELHSAVSPSLAVSRDTIRKFRQQLKHRDAMIMEMQSQLTDKDRAIFSLRGQLKETDGSILSTQEEQEQDQLLVLQRAKQHVEAELIGIRAMAREMASLLEVSERDRLRLHHAVSQLQRKLVFQAKELHTMKAMCMAEHKVYDNHRYGDEQDESCSSMDSYLQAKVHPQEESQLIVAAKDWSFSSSSSVAAESSSNEYEEQQHILRIEESPGVMIGSPTIPGSRSMDGDATSSSGARRYLFHTEEMHSAAQQQLDSTEQQQLQQLYTTEQQQQQSSEEEQLLDDLVKVVVN